MDETKATKAANGELSSVRGKTKSPKRDPVYEAALGTRIRAARVAAKMSQGALAEAVGITLQHVRKYESGRGRVAVSTLQGIAAALGVHPGSFFDADTPVPTGSISDVKRALKSADLLGQIRDPRVLKQMLALARVLVEGEP